MKLKLSCDIETTARHIACISIAWNDRESICIPIIDPDKPGFHYWQEDEEFHIILKLKELLEHPNVEIVWQNGAYDLQHLARWWGVRASLHEDTMLMQHVCFPGEKKSLDFLASVYCRVYQYWKDELTDYRKMPEDTTQFWTYNCKDTAITYEVHEVLRELIEQLGLKEQYEFLIKTGNNALRTMLRGIRVSEQTRADMTLQVYSAIQQREALLIEWLGEPLNVGSPKQMQKLFYEEFNMKPVYAKTGRPTCDAEALETLASREVLLRPLVQVINELRSLGVFLSTFLRMPLDADKRMRCYFNVAGTETFRLSSSENAFGNGGNLQNIPRNHEE